MPTSIGSEDNTLLHLVSSGSQYIKIDSICSTSRIGEVVALMLMISESIALSHELIYAMLLRDALGV